MPNNEEEKSGLLHHSHSLEPGNPYDPDAHGADEAATPELIERAASESHHGLIREPDREKLGREEEAKLALEHTEISPVTAWVMTILFLITICIPAILQVIIEVRHRNQEPRDTGVAARGLPPSLDLSDELPTWEQIGNARSFADVKNLIPDATRLKSHETSLEDESVIVRWMLPRAQTVLTRWGVGNEQAYIGRDDWLFYRPDVDYLTSPGFLDPALLQTRRRAGESLEDGTLLQPDPIRAIVNFRNQLATRNIELIVMPMPVKPMLHPDKMSPRYGASTPILQNPSYEKFLSLLHQRQVLVYDPTTKLREQKSVIGTPQFLETDTHWRPEAMQNIARDLAAFIEKNTQVKRGGTEFLRRARNIENLGDTAVMLSLPGDQKLFSKQSVKINQIIGPDGSGWRRDKNADVLLLGDSFCNIYSLPGMGWGQSAGFGEHLSYYLKRPLDSIIVNAGGSHTSRQRLVGEMKRAKNKGSNRLKKTKLVIWEFSMRDLLIGDWKLFELP